jgi:hypothetical protein
MTVDDESDLRRQSEKTAGDGHCRRVTEVWRTKESMELSSLLRNSFPHLVFGDPIVTCPCESVSSSGTGREAEAAWIGLSGKTCIGEAPLRGNVKHLTLN